MEQQQIQVRDLLIPLEKYPHLNENQMLQEAIQTFMELRQENGGRIKYGMLFVVNNSNQLVGKLSIMDILHGFAPRLFEGARVKKFDGKEGDYPGLALLHEESVYAVCGKSRTNPIKKYLRSIDFTLSVDIPVLEALVMMSSRNEHDVPVTDKGTIIGVLRLEEIFVAMCSSVCMMPKI